VISLLKKLFSSKITNFLAILFVCYSIFLPQTLFSKSADTLWSENWEGNWSDDWHADAGTWNAGTPTSGPNSAHQGQNSAATVLDGNYAEPVDSRLIRHISFTVPSASQNPRLRFWHWYKFSTYDYGQVQIKVGNGSWEAISTNYTNTGSAVWTYPSIDLSAYADSTIQIAFYFHSHRTYEYGSSGNTSSGWYIDDIAVITGPIQFYVFEDFESGMGDWYVERGTWEVGTFATHSGQNGAATVIGGSYAEPVDSRFISPEFIVPDSDENPRLRFWHRYSFSTHDYGRIQVKINGGSWQSISPKYTSSSSNVWTYPYFDLSAYADSSIQIAFYFHSHRTYEYGSSANVSWGWLIDEVSIITGPIQFNNPTNFESGIGDWSTERGTWQIGEPTTGPDSAYSSPNCAATVLAGNYYEPVDSRLISPPLTVPTVNKNPSLRFRHWYSFSTYDYGYVQIKTAHSDWTTISNNYINTSSNVWTYPYFDLSAYADSTIQIAFNFHSNRTYEYGSSGNVSTGWYIDDINIVGYTSPSIYVTPGSLDFGEVPVGKTKQDTITITNTGNDTLHVSSISGDSPQNFSVDETPFNLLPDSSKYLIVSFTPDTIGNYDATLNIESDGGNTSIALTGNGTSGTGIDNKELLFPTEFSLYQNYPNPFNPVTNISFALPKAGNVKLEIYNALGQKVADLLNKYKPAGYHSVKFDGSRLASGVYYYKIQAGKYVQVKKMLLVK